MSRSSQRTPEVPFNPMTLADLIQDIAERANGLDEAKRFAAVHDGLASAAAVLTDLQASMIDSADNEKVVDDALKNLRAMT